MYKEDINSLFEMQIWPKLRSLHKTQSFTRNKEVKNTNAYIWLQRNIEGFPEWMKCRTNGRNYLEIGLPLKVTVLHISSLHENDMTILSCEILLFTACADVG